MTFPFYLNSHIHFLACVSIRQVTQTLWLPYPYSFPWHCMCAFFFSRIETTATATYCWGFGYYFEKNKTEWESKRETRQKKNVTMLMTTVQTATQALLTRCIINVHVICFPVEKLETLFFFCILDEYSVHSHFISCEDFFFVSLFIGHIRMKWTEKKNIKLETRWYYAQQWVTTSRCNSSTSNKEWE